MPDELSVVGELSRFDRVLNHVQEMGLVLEIVDLRGVLINASTRRQIYQKRIPIGTASARIMPTGR